MVSYAAFMNEELSPLGNLHALPTVLGLLDLSILVLRIISSIPGTRGLKGLELVVVYSILSSGWTSAAGFSALFFD